MLCELRAEAFTKKAIKLRYTLGLYSLNFIQINIPLVIFGSKTLLDAFHWSLKLGILFTYGVE